MPHQHKKESKLNILKRIIFIIIGASLVSTSIEVFLVPNSIIDGGIVGISIMLSHITGIKLALFLLILNAPFLIIGYKKIGKTFALSTLLGIVVMSFTTLFLHSFGKATEEPLLAAVFGGILLGIGVGLVIRYGGSLDGTEITAILLNEKVPFSVGEIVMFLNLFILGSAGFVFGWDNAMFSLITYYIAFKMIDLTVEGFEESKKILIISDSHKEIGEAIQNRLGRGVTYINAEGGFSGDHKKIVYCVIMRLEEAKLKNIVNEIDNQAFIEISHVADIRGAQFKKNIH